MKREGRDDDEECSTRPESAQTVHGAEIPFFIMPSSAIRSLRNELEISDGEEKTRGIMQRYGYRCGEDMVKDMAFECPSPEEIPTTLEGIWAEVGLGRPHVQIINDDEYLVTLEESIESRPSDTGTAPSCQFTSGYITGIISALLGVHFSSKEEQCIAKGDKICLHRLRKTSAMFRPTYEENAHTSRKYDLKIGYSYLIESDRSRLTFDVFKDAVTHGHQGLCITRDFPRHVMQAHNLKKTPMLWLTKAESDQSVNPSQLGEIYHRIEGFLKRSERSMILFDGIEYLIVQSNYNSVLKLIQLIKDQIALYNSILLIRLSPTALERKQLKLLQLELTCLDPEEIGKRPKRRSSYDFEGLTRRMGDED